MTFDKFVETYNGQEIDYDGGCGIQCVDLAKLYIDKVIGVKPENIGNAEAYWNRYNEVAELYDNFIQVENDKNYYPQKRRFSYMGECSLWTYSNSRWRKPHF